MRPTSCAEADTILIAAQEDTFNDVFMAEHRWYPVRIDAGRLNALRWIAAYRALPRQAITHYARILEVLPHMETGRHAIHFAAPELLERALPLGQHRSAAIQGHRYVNLEDLMSSQTVGELLRRGR